MKRRHLIRGAGTSIAGATMLTLSGCLNEFGRSENGEETSSRTAPEEGEETSSRTTPEEGEETSSRTTIQKPEETSGTMTGKSAHPPHPVDLVIVNDSSEKVRSKLVVTSNNKVKLDKNLDIDPTSTERLDGAFEPPRKESESNTYLIELFENETLLFEEILRLDLVVHRVRLSLKEDKDAKEITITQIVH